MLDRVLEPETMDSVAEADAYDTMDFREVNARFVADLRQAVGRVGLVLDVGTGTARIPLELLRQEPTATVVGVDLARAMLAQGQRNVAAAGADERIVLVLTDAKALPFCDTSFPQVCSNSIIHHIPEPLGALREMLRVLRPGGTLFVRDLFRPESNAEVERLVNLHAANDDAEQRQLFRQSLQAALTVAEVQDLARDLGLPTEGVSATSDRHWTWIARKP